MNRLYAAACVLALSACSSLSHQSFVPEANGAAPAQAQAQAGFGLPGVAKDLAGSTILYTGNACSDYHVLAFPLSANGNVAPSWSISSPVLKKTLGLWATPSRLWVTASASNALLGYSLQASGSAGPAIKIAGSNLGGWIPAAVIQDPATGQLFVSDQKNHRIVVLAGNANGNATPLRTIAGSATTLKKPAGLFLTASNQIGVVDVNANAVDLFPETASGNVAPASRLTGASTGLNGPEDAVPYGKYLYVSNTQANTISVFALNASGNVAPLHTMFGSNTGLRWPWQMAFDGQGNLYVANPLTYVITVYPWNAWGNPAPTQTIAGNQTDLTCDSGLALAHTPQLYVPDVHTVDAFRQNAYGYENWLWQLTGLPALSAPQAVAFDRSGNQYVVDNAGQIDEYAPGASGAAAPLRTIAGAATQLQHPNSIGLDDVGNIYVGNSNATVTVYAASASGNAAPARTIGGAATHVQGSIGQIVVKPAGDFYTVSSTGNNVLHFAAGATGNVAPIAEIAGASTGISGPLALAVNGHGIYEADASGMVVRVFAPSANGNVAPAATIGGSASGFTTPRGLALDQAGDVYLSDCNARAVFVFAPGASGNAIPIRELGGADSRFSCPLMPTVY